MTEGQEEALVRNCQDIRRLIETPEVANLDASYALVQFEAALSNEQTRNHPAVANVFKVASAPRIKTRFESDIISAYCKYFPQPSRSQSSIPTGAYASAPRA